MTAKGSLKLAASPSFLPTVPAVFHPVSAASVGKSHEGEEKPNVTRQSINSARLSHLEIGLFQRKSEANDDRFGFGFILAAYLFTQTISSDLKMEFTI